MSQVDQNKLSVGNSIEFSKITPSQELVSRATETSKCSDCPDSNAPQSHFSKGPSLSLDHKIKLDTPIAGRLWFHGREANLREVLVSAGRGDFLAQSYLQSFIRNELDQFGSLSSKNEEGVKANQNQDIAELIIQFHKGSEEERLQAAETLIHYIIEHAGASGEERDLALGALLFFESLSESDHTEVLYNAVAGLGKDEAEQLAALCKDQASPKLLKAIQKAQSDTKAAPKKAVEAKKQEEPVAQDLGPKTAHPKIVSAGLSEPSFNVPVEESSVSSGPKLAPFKPFAPNNTNVDLAADTAQPSSFTPAQSPAEAIEQSLAKAFKNSAVAQYIDIPALQMRLETLFSKSQDKGAVITANTLYIAILAAGQNPPFTTVRQNYAPLRPIAAEIASNVVKKTGLAASGQELALAETRTPVPPALVSGKPVNQRAILETLVAAKNTDLQGQAATVALGTVPNSSTAAAGMMAALAGQWKFGSASFNTQYGFGGSSRPSYFVEETGNSPQSQDGQGQGGQSESEEENPGQKNQSPSEAQAFAWA